jgi:hypothetical protein
MYVGKSKSLSKSGALEGCFTKWIKALLTNIRRACKGLPGINTVEYNEYS